MLPALNEEASLPFVLASLPARLVDLAIVVDNGSTDRTAKVARQAGAHVVFEPVRGYGSAMLRGLAELDCRSPKVDIVVFLDADFSDDPSRLVDLLAPIIAGRADFVLGSRLLGERESGAMPIQSTLGNRFACWLIRRLTGVRYTDLGPFRAIRRSTLVELGMVDTGFGWTVEMQIKAALAGVGVLEVPIPYRRRIGTSKISGTLFGSVRAGWKILYTIARYGLSPATRRHFARRRHAQRQRPAA